MNFLLIIIFVLIGWLVKRNQWISEAGIGYLNKYVIWICLPAIALLKLPQIELNWSLLFPALMTWFLLPILILCVLALAKGYRWERNVTGCMLMLVCFGNTSFVGFPIIQGFLGKDAVAYAFIYDQIGSFLGLAIVGNLFIAYYATSRDGSKQSSLKLLVKVLTFPPFVAMVVAVVLNGGYLNSITTQILSIISMTLVPATMLLVGAHFKLQLEVKMRVPLIWGLSLKMLVAPLLAFLILKLSQQHQLSAQVTLMEAAMPPMVTASILAINAKLAPQLAAVAVGYGMILAVIVMPLINLLITFL